MKTKKERKRERKNNSVIFFLFILFPFSGSSDPKIPSYSSKYTNIQTYKVIDILALIEKQFDLTEFFLLKKPKPPSSH